ncbi:transcription repressor NadR [Celerinatantimonas yamalensis]|uniref:Transcription repressor NadR n=1 Tax=Celerinatantimonas yamalensis TaxID=559956 RepID=A0ABW9GBI3_9GAMM
MAKKLIGEQRRQRIVAWLQAENGPLTGTQLADLTEVSRQVIVQDIALLKAKNEPIIATTQGYIYQSTVALSSQYEQVIACQHHPEQTQDELQLLVDHGVTVNNVIVEHALYGEITAQLHIHNRKDVQAFIQKMHSTGASYLSELTHGVHLHTLCANSQEQLDQAINSLQEAGFLVSDE